MSELSLRGLQTITLRPVDLIIPAGELIFVSGPSGSGKSLLLRAIADLDPHEGEAWLDDRARSAMSAPQWRRQVGLLPAESFWWSETVGDHFPPARTDADRLLSALGFGPDCLGWSVERISTGERQRLALARLLARHPRALLLDEATANLDPANRARVEALITDYRQRHAAAVLWVSHDPEQRRRLGGGRMMIRDGYLVEEQ